MEKKKSIVWGLVALFLVALVALFAAYRYVFLKKMPSDEEERVIFIDADDTVDSIDVKSGMGWRFACYRRFMELQPHTGRYCVEGGMRYLDLYRKLRFGTQDPMRVTIPSLRTLDRLAGFLGHQFMCDSTAFAQAFETEGKEMGYSRETLPELFIPNTYEFYWDITPSRFMQRMQRENEAFWNAQREKKAKALGLTHLQVSTLASIVEEETANNGEKPMIAGLYLNRLHKGMLLQADPTVKFAMQAFALRRIYNTHLRYDSPYNTYLYPGLPPGPIRMPSIIGLDAVLNRVEHPYLYMCAKEDFSGTHNFAATYGEHLRNARRYVQALNARGIK